MASIEHKTHTEAVNIYILRSIQTIFFNTPHVQTKRFAHAIHKTSSIIGLFNLTRGI